MRRHVNFLVSLGFLGLSVITPNASSQAISRGFDSCSTDLCVSDINTSERDSACMFDNSADYSKKIKSNLPLMRQAMRTAAVMISEADNLSEANSAFSDLLGQAEIFLGKNKSLASQTMLIAEKFYAIIQSAWFKGYKHGALEIAINPSIRLFNQSAGSEVVSEIKPASVIDGAVYVSKLEYLSAIEDMKLFVADLLREGSTNEQEILDFLSYKKYLVDQRNPWSKRKLSDPNLEEWALSNPSLDAKIEETNRDKIHMNSADATSLSVLYPLLSGLPELNPFVGCY